MADYVLYCLDESKLVRCERFTAADDESAIREAMRRRDSHAAELWCGPRRVRTFGKESVAH